MHPHKIQKQNSNKDIINREQSIINHKRNIVPTTQNQIFVHIPTINPISTTTTTTKTTTNIR